MSHFLQNIIQRQQAAPPNTVQPRLNGVFEFSQPAAEIQAETPEFDSGQAPMPPKSDIFTSPLLPDSPVSNAAAGADAQARQLTQPDVVARHLITQITKTVQAIQPREKHANPAMATALPFTQKPEQAGQMPETRQETIAAITQHFQQDPAAAEQQDKSTTLQILPPPSPLLLQNTPVAGGKNAETPIVKIHIGRIEIKAVQQPQPPQPRRTTPAPQAALSLEDYLKARKG